MKTEQEGLLLGFNERASQSELDQSSHVRHRVQLLSSHDSVIFLAML